MLAQSVDVVAQPAAEIDRAAKSKHVAAPSAADYLSAKQSEHAVDVAAPAAGECLAAEHSVHNNAQPAEEINPNAKIEHVIDPTNDGIAKAEKNENKIEIANPAIIFKPFRYQLQYIRSRRDSTNHRILWLIESLLWLICH